MVIQTFRVKQYNSKPVTVLVVNGEPICTVRGGDSLSKILSRLSGYDVSLFDKKIERKIDSIRGGLNHGYERG